MEIYTIDGIDREWAIRDAKKITRYARTLQQWFEDDPEGINEIVIECIAEIADMLAWRLENYLRKQEPAAVEQAAEDGADDGDN